MLKAIRVINSKYSFIQILFSLKSGGLSQSILCCIRGSFSTSIMGVISWDSVPQKNNEIIVFSMSAQFANDHYHLLTTGYQLLRLFINVYQLSLGNGHRAFVNNSTGNLIQFWCAFERKLYIYNHNEHTICHGFLRWQWQWQCDHYHKYCCILFKLYT